MTLPAGSVRGSRVRRIDASIPELASDLTERVRSEDWVQHHESARLLGTLAAEIESRATPANRYSAQKSATHLANLRSHPDISGPDMPELQGATCLDFGCGGLNPGGALFTLLLAGAQRGVGIDLDDIQSVPCATRALYTVLCAALTGTLKPPIQASPQEILDRVATFDVEKLAQGDGGGVDLDRLAYLQKPLDQAGLEDASIDMCFSNSVFEHLDDPGAVIDELARVMKPGGLAVHAIDGYDHRHYAKTSVHPLDFLAEQSEAVIVHGCNRIRPLEFGPMFEERGFEVRGVLESPPIELDDRMLATFAPRFRQLPQKHLEVLRARYYLRRR